MDKKNLPRLFTSYWKQRWKLLQHNQFEILSPKKVILTTLNVENKFEVIYETLEGS